MTEEVQTASTSVFSSLTRRPFMLLGAGLLVAALAWVWLGKGAAEEPYRTAAITKGEISRVVSATGALEPLVKVEVGSTVSGLVQSVEADFNSPVRVGQVLARLDPSTFTQKVVQGRANVASAEAQLAVAEADYQRYLRLEQRGFASDQLMQQQRAARDSARAAVDQARAALNSAQIDLDRSIIRSPINGVVVDRKIDVGQSVAASFQAPTLFVIAQDLSRLQANITVDEADIGEVRQDQDVRFTVDAFPDMQFDGRVTQVRQQGASDSGVVSYTVVVQADNPDRKLLPGMTANAEIVIERRENVLRLPNAALRFRPADPRLEARAEQLTSAQPNGARPTPVSAPSNAGGPSGGGPGGGHGMDRLAQALELTPSQQQQAQDAVRAMFQSGGARPGPDMNDAQRNAFRRRMRDAALKAVEPSLSPHQKELLAAMQASESAPGREVRRQAVAWVLRNGAPEPVAIEVGVADSNATSVLSGLSEGDEVIIGGGPAPKDQGPRGPLGGPAIRIRGS